MQYKELLFLSMTWFIIPQQTTSSEKRLERNDLTEIDQCVLCAYCKPRYSVDTKKNKQGCTIANDLVKRVDKRNYCFEHGDWSELIGHNSSAKDCAHGHSFRCFRNLVSVVPPSNKNQSCYFKITYYNTSSDSEIANDVVLLRYRKKEEVQSENGKWETGYDMYDYQYYINPMIDIPEGNYKFHFNNSVVIDQFYIKKERQLKKEYYTNKCENRKCLEDIINSSGKLNATVKPVYLNDTEVQTDTNALSFEDKEMASSFRNCFIYNLTHNATHEPLGLKIRVMCKTSNTQEHRCTLRWHNASKKLEIQISDPKIFFTEVQGGRNRMNTLRIDLICTIYDYRRRFYYGFHQPVIVQQLDLETLPTTNPTTASTVTSDQEIIFLTTRYTTISITTNSAGTSNPLVIVLGFVFLALVISCVVYWKKKKIKTNKENVFKEADNYSNVEWVAKPEYSPSVSVTSESPSRAEDAYVLPEWLRNKNEMIYDPSRIEKGRQLGHGHFGAVFEGKIHLRNAVYPVAIKCPKASMPGGIDVFLEEAKSMLEVDDYHANIVNLQGMTYKNSSPEESSIDFSLILEYCSKGNLRSYLIDHENEFKKSLEYYEKNKVLEPLVKSEVEGISHDVALLHCWTYQVSNGMEYLAQKHIHHGDLAARNILLTDSLVAKISDFGLSRRFYVDVTEPQPIVKPRDDNNRVPLILPMKWLPLETLLHQKIRPEKSDVWSFGVLIWEIFQLGADPYRKGMELQQLILELKAGIRLPTPYCCPSTIANLIPACFKEHPTERPSFLEIKNSVLLAHSEIKRASAASNKVEVENQEVVHYADIRMEQQYLEMKKQNQNLEDIMKTQTNYSSRVTFNPASLTASFTTDVGRYVSLQNVNSSMSKIPSSWSESHDSLLNNIENSMDGVNIGNRHSISPVSPISPEYKRHFSFTAGEGPTPILRPQKRYSGLTPAKSYPNPLYMMTLENLDCTKPPVI